MLETPSSLSDSHLPPEETLRALLAVVEGQDYWRRRTINLIASENVLSPVALRAMSSDFVARYAEGHPGARYYEGTRYIDEVEARLALEVRSLFRCSRADVRPVTGTVANIAAFSGLVPPGTTVLAHGVPAGGHISHQKYGALGKMAGKIKALPLEADGLAVDVEKARKLVRELKPSTVVLGRSLFLFPEPVTELREVCDEVGALLLYDAAHVLGLVACGKFQDPLHEGAHFMMGSTHKTFFGPQRGVVLSDTADDALWKKVDRGVFPGATSNHHLFSLPSMLVATLEMRVFGSAYVTAVTENAVAFARALHSRGVPVVGEARGFTRSHQVAIDCTSFGGGKSSARRLSEQGVVANYNMLPGDDPKTAMDPRGIRFGVQEMTRFGAGVGEMESMAELIAVCLRRDRDISAEVVRFREGLQEIRYTFEGVVHA
jgi:glycine hydroxymethyltransferase